MSIPAVVLLYPGPTHRSKSSSLQGACLANGGTSLCGLDVYKLFGHVAGCSGSVACACSYHVPLWEAVRAGKGVCLALSGCGGEAAGHFPEAGAVHLHR